MAKWVVNTVEDFVTVECDYFEVDRDGVLLAYNRGAIGVGGWADKFWLSYHKQEDST